MRHSSLVMLSLISVIIVSMVDNPYVSNDLKKAGVAPTATAPSYANASNA